MPELPEVETMVRGIQPHVVSRTILSFDRCPNHCKSISIVPSIKKLQKRLVGRQFSGVYRLGKRVVLKVDDGASVVIEPRMTGLVLLENPPDLSHLRLKWDFDGKGKYDSLYFWDRRGLGVVRLYEPGELEVQLGSKKLGPDAMAFEKSDWIERCSKTRREIKVVLLDQKIVAGIGNLYASEILHLAGISPDLPAVELNSKMFDRLNRAVRTVLTKAIDCEGSTLGDGTYRNALNENGSYQNHHCVYMKAGEICPTCNKGTIERIVQAQRSTFFCPNCQKRR